ncbi:MAG: hypothetical protein VX498_06585, partial [Myxococcota bacterium]|nr:hypothetical protein [Myxococcota bacterium]
RGSPRRAADSVNALLPVVAPLGRLDSPEDLEDILNALKRLRAPRRGPQRLRFVALARAHVQIHLRELWITVHRSGGALERAAELEQECAILRRAIPEAAEFQLSLFLDRRSIEV